MKASHIWLALKSVTDTMTETVMDPGEVFDPPSKDTGWVIIEDRRALAQRVMISPGVGNFKTGQLYLMCMTPIGWTHAQTLGFASDVGAYFTEGQALTYETANLRIAKEPQVIDVSYRDGDWIRTPVRVDWESV